MNFKTCSRLLLAFGIIVGLQLISATSIGAITAQWTQTGAGPFSWGTSGNWTPATPPNGTSDVANFTAAGGPATPTVNLNASITIGTITISTIDLSNATTGYTIANGAGGSLTFNNGAADARINNSSTPSGVPLQPQVIDTNLTIGATSLSVSQTATSSLTLNGTLDTNGLPFNVSSAGPVSVTNVISGNGSVNKRFNGPAWGHVLTENVLPVLHRK